MDIWYHGSDRKFSKIKVSQFLKLDYETEDGAWLTSSKIQAGFYGKYIYEFDSSDLKILDKSKLDKNEFVIDYWVNKMGKDKSKILNYMRLEDEHKDFYDVAFIAEVYDNGFDAVKLRGEFDKGYDLWVDYWGVKKLKMLNMYKL